MQGSPNQKISVLLGTADSGGTIAAVRSLAAAGLVVNVAASGTLCAAGWSRSVTRTWRVPSEREPDRLLARLMAIGAAEPGQVLIPTSDATAWLYTEQASELGRRFRLCQPSSAVLQRILDKKLLTDAATSAGLAVVESWDPADDGELARLAPTLPYPILIKPRTHVYRLGNDKGAVVHTAEGLLAEYRRLSRREAQRTKASTFFPSAGRPLLQRFVRVGAEGIQSVSGFIDRSGELFVTRRARKVFQRSTPVGVGVCFEALPPAPELSKGVRRLCRELGFFGVFEVEFVFHNGEWRTIDFNPRLFNQLGLDIRRGCNSPLLLALDGMGETDRLKAEVAKAKAEDVASKAVWLDRTTLGSILTARSLSRRIGDAELAHWRGWAERHGDDAVDVVRDANDPLPVVVHALSEIVLGFKAVPRFLRSTPKVSSDTAKVLMAERP